jgi:leucyl aminopeptidase
MKFDMGGAAATLGAARILAATQPEGVEVGGMSNGDAGCLFACCI